MSTTATLRAPGQVQTLPKVSMSERLRTDPAYQAFMLLRIAFTVAPILFGLDKFFNTMVDWEQYLAPWINDLSPLSATHTMYVVGVIEMVAGLAEPGGTDPLEVRAGLDAVLADLRGRGLIEEVAA